MVKKRVIRRILSTITVFAMVVASISSGAPKQVQAEVGTKEVSSNYLNTTRKYLNLGEQDAGSFDFNIKKEAEKEGATYYWYVKADKGAPNSVTINKNTGVVTAKKVGTAYIRCKITSADGTYLRTEAKVTVINNITEVKINNIPKDLTITAGVAQDFNRTVLSTASGKGVKTQGITRWEIAEDTANAQSATTKGIVYPTSEGKFMLRAICFQNTSKYNQWLTNKEANAVYITAASEWVTIKVASADGVAIASSEEQINKLLAADNMNQITIATKEALTFVIPKGDYSKKTLIVDAPNADVENYGIFKEITIKAIRDNTWIEYADGNIVYLTDDVTSFIIEAGAQVKRIVLDRPNATLNLEIRGTVEQITVTQPSSLNITGGGGNVPVTVEDTAGGSTITTSMPLNLELKARTEVILEEGAEETILDKSESSVEVKVENNTKKVVTITTGNTGGVTIEAGKAGVSNETTKATPTPTPIQTPTDTITPTQVPSTTVAVTSIIVTSEISQDDLTLVHAQVFPENATDKSVTWSVIDGTGSGSISYGQINMDGELGFALNPKDPTDPTSYGTVTVKATAKDGSLVVGTQEITLLQSIQATYDATAGSHTITATLTTGTFDPVNATVITNWRLGSSDAAGLGTISGVVISKDNRTAIITVTGTLHVNQTYSIRINQGAVAYGFRTSSHWWAISTHPIPVDLAEIDGVTPPKTGVDPVSSITSDQYIGGVQWQPRNYPFAKDTVYTATINIMRNQDYYNDVTANFFTVAGATSVTNDAASDIITVVFPATGDEPIAKSADTWGMYVTVEFDEDMASAEGKQDEFTVLVDGNENVVTKAQLDKDAKYIMLTLTTPILYGSEVTLEYSAGTVKDAENDVLASFSLPIENNVQDEAIFDLQKVAAAKFAVNDGTIIVAYDADQTIETAAVQTYVNGLITNGVTAVVTHLFAFMYNIDYALNAATDSENIIMTKLWLLDNLGDVTGIPRVGDLLTAGALTPAFASVNYQWKISDSSDSGYTDIPGETNKYYTPVISDIGKYIKVTATGQNNNGYIGTVNSSATSAVVAARIILGTPTNFKISDASVISWDAVENSASYIIVIYDALTDTTICGAQCITNSYDWNEGYGKASSTTLSGGRYYYASVTAAAFPGTNYSQSPYSEKSANIYKKELPQKNSVSAQSVQIGKTLAESAFSGTMVNASNEIVPGEFTWDDDTTIVAYAYNNYLYTFTPTDTALYSIVKGILPITGTSAIVGDVTVSGVSGSAITVTNVTITLVNDTIKTSIAADTDLSGWITNLPVGLTAKANETVAGARTVTITIAGIPTEVLSATMAFTVPAAYLLSNSEIAVVVNANAKFEVIN
ncbi:MAG: SwmB domain-containing protein [Mobilitalea sp.]